MSKKKNYRTVEGEELTPEYLDEIVADAEAGYPGADFRRVRVGRPSISASGHSKRLQIRVDPEMDLELKQIASKRDATVSEIAREALARYLADAA